MDLLPESAEAPSGKSRLVLVDRPALQPFANLGATASLGGFSCRPNGSLADRDFEVVQNGPNQFLIEVFQDGTQINRGELAAPTTSNVTFADNGVQLAICTGGNIWVFNYSTDALTGPVSGLIGPISLIDCCDGFGIALLQNSNQWQMSALLDFTSWPGTSVAQVSEFPDNVISLIVNQRGIWFQGRKATVPYYNAGALFVPFVPVPGVFIENGAGSVFGRAKLDNTIFWWDASERGRGIARLARGYTPSRVSTHAIEVIVGAYADISDAISWAEEREGHTLFVTYFPSGTSFEGIAGKGSTLVYDVSTNMWSEWSYWNQKSGTREAYHARNHRFAWGKHLVGDWSSGNLYQSDFPSPTVSGWSFVTDAGNAIRRLRRAPHVSTENQWMFHHELVVDCETGISPQPPLSGPSINPQQYFLPDANGGVWALTCDDNARLYVNPAPKGSVASNLILTDTKTKTSYILTVELDSKGNFDGNLANPTIYDSQAPTFLPIATTGFKDCSISIVNGQMETAAVTSSVREPQLMMRYSNDHAHTWSQYHAMGLGMAGEYTRRAIARRLGRARTRTYEITFTDPVPLRIVDAYLKASPGYQPMPRTIKQFQENA